MASNLFTPVLNDRTRSPHFFNGRLLTGEAMTDEHRANHVAREMLAQAVGDGVVYGLEVSTATSVSTLDTPIVTVKSGVAINRCGEILLLAHDTDVQLVRPVEQVAGAPKTFRTCTPVSSGTYVADAGVYLLTISSIRAGNGLAKVSGLGDTPAGCNVKYIVDAVEFRLMELPVSEGTLSDVGRLRNRVAYECFGVTDLPDFVTDPFAANSESQTPLDKLRKDDELSDCDVPLAVFYWTASGGVVFIDLWAVRRRITRTNTPLFPAVSDAGLARAEAMVLQFQEQIAELATQLTSTTMTATSRFRHLPPFGMIPIGSTPGRDFSTLAFFTSLKTRGPFYLEGSRVSSVVRQAVDFFPVDLQLDEQELIWLYRIRENQEAIDDLTTAPPRAALLFVTGHAPWRGDAHYDVSKWTYASYA